MIDGMATGLTQTLSEQRAIDTTFISNYYIDEVNRLINDKHYFVAFLVISSGIEFLGKAISDHDWFETGTSKKDFNLALSVFTSLNKYENLGLKYDNATNDISFYSIVRCGIVHASTPLLGITLSEGANNLPKEIGITDLASDINNACNDLLNGVVPLGKGKKLSDIICYY